MMTNEILYLSDSNIIDLDLSLASIQEAITSAFQSKATQESWVSDKATVLLKAGHMFQAKPGLLGSEKVAGLKWFGLVPQRANNNTSINSVILISNVTTGKLKAIVQANWITEKRTAAMTAVAAQKLANQSSETIGFIGAGVQAFGHLEALSGVLPNLKHAVMFSRTETSAQKLANAAIKLGLEAQVTTDPLKAVKGMDVVVSTVPEGAWAHPLLEPDLVKSGAFIAAVDLARNWDNTKLREFDILATDDREQTKTMFEVGRMGWGGPYEYDLADICLESFAGRKHKDQRVLFNFSGHALADLAVAVIAIDAATTNNIGTKLGG